MLLPLLATALAGPHLSLHHEGAWVVHAEPSVEQAARLLSGATVRGTHRDEYDEMHVLSVTADQVGELARGQVLRGWVETDRFVDCTVRGFVAEVPGSGELPSPLPEGTRVTWLAELACEADPGESWLVAPGAPVPYAPALRDVIAPTALARVEAHPAFVALLASATQEAGERPLRRDQQIARFDTPAGHHLLLRGRLYTGTGDFECGSDDVAQGWVAIVREGADPEVLEVHRLGDDIVAGVLDLDRDGRLELEIHDVFGDHVTLTREGVTLSSALRVWWSYCPC